ncbi:MAG TPA: trimethylamine methyltransferase family protein [Desulfobacterales bacterium]|nr:trimethylamine methyltransferase family protein [Desulfobacterales bacterium]
MNDTAQKPFLCFLSREDKEKLHRSALTILNEIGMQVFHEEALAILKSAGCTVFKDERVLIPGNLVENAIQSAPSRILICSREGSPAMNLWDYESHFGTGSDLIYSLDSEKMQRHRSVIEDVGLAARVCDALPNIDFIMSCAHPSDVPPHQSYLKSFQVMAENSSKPIVCTAECRNDLNAIWEIATILREGELSLRKRPYFMHYAEPISPFKHPFSSLDKLLFCAEKKIPVIYSPAPIAGSTAPITIAGHVAQGLAECFCGLVIHQLKATGAPFIMGIGPAVMDMTSCQCSYNAPEYYLAYMAIIEMSHYYNLPSWGYAGTSDSQVPDGQAVFEAGLSTFLSTMSGANLNHDVGYLDFGLTGSLDMIVISDEIIDEVRRLRKGIPINKETIGLDAMREVGFAGNFLTHPHTLKHLRTTQWRPKLFTRMSHEKWEKSGSPRLLDRARQRLQKLVETHRPVKISEEKAREIQRRMDEFEG